MVLNIPGGLFEQRDVRETPTGEVTTGEKPPIGSIIAWAKTLTSTPALPSGWLECDGSVVSDSGSVYDGVTLPDLNGNNQFVRGNSTSGGTGGSDTHTLSIAELPSHNHPSNDGGFVDTDQAGSGVNLMINSTPGNATGNTGSGNAHENKPPYYDVVWIIRIK